MIARHACLVCGRKKFNLGSSITAINNVRIEVKLPMSIFTKNSSNELRTFFTHTIFKYDKRGRG